MPIFGGDISGI